MIICGRRGDGRIKLKIECIYPTSVCYEGMVPTVVRGTLVDIVTAFVYNGCRRLNALLLGAPIQSTFVNHVC